MNNNYFLTPKISICISVHNTDRFLSRCLDSVLKQTIDSFEIVIVDNGSTDNSLNIMKQYQLENPCVSITIISQNDLGLAQGRQTGVNNSKGEYITFLDADDYVTPNAYQRLYDTAQYGKYDIVECLTERNGKYIGSPYEGECSPKELVCRYFIDASVPSMLWMRIYKHCLFDINTFPVTYVNNEDNYVFPCVVFRAKSYYCLRERLHFYSTDNESAVMNSLKISERDELKVYENRKRYLESIPYIYNRINIPHQNAVCQNAFKCFVKRTCLNYCISNSKLITLDDRFKYIYEVLETNKHNFNVFYSEKNKGLILVDKFISLFGYELGLKIYFPLYKFAKCIKRRLK